MSEYKWSTWKKVDLTSYPFYLPYTEEERLEDPIGFKENKILLDIFSAELGTEDRQLEYFDSEQEGPPPRIPDEFKIYCPIEEQDTDYWPHEIGNTKEYPHDWDKWFFLNHNSLHHTNVSGFKNRRLGDGWYFLLFEGLSPIFIRPIKWRMRR